jgi:GNAT superfamily N-acetyltransferase
VQVNAESTAADFTPIAVTLRGGRRVTLRSIRPDDGAALQAAFRGLSTESRYTRFMSAVNELSPSMLKHAVHPVAGRDLALVALAEPAVADEDVNIVGGARYGADAARQTCEFAITVSEDWRGTGLASRLMQELIRSARAQGLTGMEGFILAGNTPMRNLAKRLGFAVTASSEGPGVVRVWLDLQADPAGALPGHEGAG